MKKKLILDVDTGVDDAQAIMLALADPNVEVLGIMCCHGNTPLENVLKNTLRVLKVCNRLDVSVVQDKGSHLGVVRSRQLNHSRCFLKHVLSCYRFQCIVAAKCHFWPKEDMQEITTARTGWAMSQTQALQAWSCFRRKKLHRPWLRL